MTNDTSKYDMTEREIRLLINLHKSDEENGRRYTAMNGAVNLLSIALGALRRDMEEGTQWRLRVVEERIALAIEELSKPMEGDA
jgi:hypothetical protein